MRRRLPVHIDALTAVGAMLIFAGFLWWLLATLNAIR